MQLCYTYLGETLISTAPYIVEENKLEDFFLDKDILFIDDQNNIYINNSSKIYQGIENNYLELDKIAVLDKYGYYKSSACPPIIYANQDYFIAKAGYYTDSNDNYGGYSNILYYTLNDLSKPQFTTAVDASYPYYKDIKLTNCTLVLLGENIYVVS